MVPQLNSSWEAYEYYVINCSDPRTDSYPLLNREPWLTLAVIAAYLGFVVTGPAFMAKREALSLKPFLLAYNFFLVALSGFMFYEYLAVSFLSGYNYLCQPVDYTYATDELSLRMVRANYLFFLSKVIELADTVIFILRKKNNQVTFLHVYHHSGMVLNWYLAAKYSAVGQSFFVGMLNSFIHTLMYTYYGLAGLGPHMQRYLWWKRYMTRLQLIQFVFIISHTGYNKFFAKDCVYPWLFNSITFYYTWSIFMLFVNFYYHTYIRRPKNLKSTNGLAANKEPTNGVHRNISNGIKLRQVGKTVTNGGL
ncbi:hypothetical protein CAPTEDRAFT_218353 [Capitella teleta]|uniref:Elongation of very long chain fatty acids protein n=1 Tax=Capitella teleta TaxID=283909 RepID=R7UL04_CAPTE|nr:hypothetical protein CAPTEDRAFT_218353 [Capitella teleta]|eukprot:ELU06920.1 hypothetical protein CAPTEDRAFT_218353 [Capitella teleta]